LAGVIEKFGQGTQNIISLCCEAGIPAPEFEETELSFIVRFRWPEKMKTEAGPQATEQAAPQVIKGLKVAAVAPVRREDLQRWGYPIENTSEWRISDRC